MLRLPSQQALKALCSPLHNPLRNPPRNPLRSPFRDPLRKPPRACYVHTEQAPFFGPPSYATITQRFSSSNPNPISFFARKEAKEAIERGEFVDIHDIGGVDPNDYDVLITDVDNNTLHSEISKLVGIPYLKEATKDEADKVVEDIHGFVYGRKYRMMLPCVLSIDDKARWVFFVVDSGAPLTYISTQVVQAFGLREEEDPWVAKIAGHSHPVYMAPSDSHFSNINLLGGDFCTMHRLRPWVSDSHRTVTYYIGKKWEVIPKL